MKRIRKQVGGNPPVEKIDGEKLKQQPKKDDKKWEVKYQLDGTTEGDCALITLTYDRHGNDNTTFRILIDTGLISENIFKRYYDAVIITHRHDDHDKGLEKIKTKLLFFNETETNVLFKGNPTVETGYKEYSKDNIIKNLASKYFEVCLEPGKLPPISVIKLIIANDETIDERLKTEMTNLLDREGIDVLILGCQKLKDLEKYKDSNDRTNGTSICTLIKTEGDNLLTCGDIDDDGFEKIMGIMTMNYSNEVEKKLILKANHHGSDTACYNQYLTKHYSKFKEIFFTSHHSVKENREIWETIKKILCKDDCPPLHVNSYYKEGCNEECKGLVQYFVKDIERNLTYPEKNIIENIKFKDISDAGHPIINASINNDEVQIVMPIVMLIFNKNHQVWKKMSYEKVGLSYDKETVTINYGQNCEIHFNTEKDKDNFIYELIRKGAEIKGFTEIKIPDNVTRIDRFTLWEGLTTIDFPKSVESIGDCFNECEKLDEKTKKRIEEIQNIQIKKNIPTANSILNELECKKLIDQERKKTVLCIYNKNYNTWIGHKMISYKTEKKQGKNNEKRNEKLAALIHCIVRLKSKEKGFTFYTGSTANLCGIQLGNYLGNAKTKAGCDSEIIEYLNKTYNFKEKITESKPK